MKKEIINRQDINEEQRKSVRHQEQKEEKPFEMR